MPTIAQAISQLQSQGLDLTDSRLLLLHAVGQARAGRAWLLAHDTDLLSEQALTTLSHLATRRLAGEPVAYLVGHKEFYGLNLQVSADVLVPRPDTETLVEWALETLEPTPDARVVDLGTGSGAIALALKATRPELQVEAVDFSHAALAVAQGNAQRLGLEVAFGQARGLAAQKAISKLLFPTHPTFAKTTNTCLPCGSSPGRH